MSKMFEPYSTGKMYGGNINSLKSALSECRKAAISGYKMASKQERELKSILKESSNILSYKMHQINESRCYIGDVSDALINQLSIIKDEIDYVSAELIDELEELNDTLDHFTIALFGRTMAGKSTLMEVLTHGDGSSIGNGSQRTTRDVRKYKWNNLNIVDLPGIAAFDGEDDEMIALDAAKKADLILFLLTDDAPQQSEAEWFAKMVALGKPILCAINVKCAIRETDDIRIIERNLNRAFDAERIDSLKEQFLKYAATYVQDWSNIPFVNIHLKAAFMSNNSFYPNAAQLLSLSKIEQLLNLIEQEVLSRGKYYREKTFIDIVTLPTLSIYIELTRQYSFNKKMSKSLKEKQSALADWEISYRSDGGQSINRLINTKRSVINTEIADFIEEHLDSETETIKADWISLMEKHARSCITLQEDFIETAKNKLSEYEREIKREYSFFASYHNDFSIDAVSLRTIVDTERLVKWGSLIVGGGLTAGALFLKAAESSLAGPVGLVAGGVLMLGGLASLVFDSREEKEEERRNELKKILGDSRDKFLEDMRRTLRRKLDSICDKEIKGMIREMEGISGALDSLSVAQSEQSRKVKQQLLNQNMQLFTCVAQLAGKPIDPFHYQRIARVPGQLMAIKLNNDGETEISSEQLQNLLNEEVIYIAHNESNAKKLIGHGVLVSNKKGGYTLNSKEEGKDKVRLKALMQLGD